MYVVGGVLIGVFALIESRFAKEPICPPRLFKNKNVLLGFIGNFFIGIAFFSLTFYLPTFFQIVRGDTATLSGVELIPLILLVSIIATASGQFTSRLGNWYDSYFVVSLSWFRVYTVFPAVGSFIFALAVGLMLLFTSTRNRGLEIGLLFLAGVGLGMVIQVSILSLQNIVKARDLAAVTALGIFFRVVRFFTSRIAFQY